MLPPAQVYSSLVHTSPLTHQQSSFNKVDIPYDLVNKNAELNSNFLRNFGNAHFLEYFI
jgi:hypothetical protein